MIEFSYPTGRSGKYAGLDVRQQVLLGRRFDDVGRDLPMLPVSATLSHSEDGSLVAAAARSSPAVVRAVLPHAAATDETLIGLEGALPSLVVVLA